MISRTPGSTRTVPLFPYTTLIRSLHRHRCHDFGQDSIYLHWRNGIAQLLAVRPEQPAAPRFGQCDDDASAETRSAVEQIFNAQPASRAHQRIAGLNLNRTDRKSTRLNSSH